MLTSMLLAADTQRTSNRSGRRPAQAICVEFVMILPRRCLITIDDEIPAAQLAKALASDPLTDAGSKIDDVVGQARRDGAAESYQSRAGGGGRFAAGPSAIVGRALGWNVLKSSRFSVAEDGSMFSFVEAVSATGLACVRTERT